MKVFQLNTYCGIKSTGRIVLSIAQQLEEHGDACFIGYGVPEISEESRPFAYKIGGKLSRKVHGAIRKLMDMEGYGSILPTFILLKKINQYKPDIIHLHNIHGCYLNHRILFSYIRKHHIPVVWTLHDCWPFTGHCAYYDAAECEQWKTECKNCPQQLNYPVCIGLDGSARNYRRKKALFNMPEQIRFAAPCHWMKQQLEKSFLKKYPAAVIVNGIDTDTFKPAESDLREQWHIGNRKLVLGIASEWDERKGLSYLLEAAKQLGSDYIFAIIGLSESQTAVLPENAMAVPSTHDARVLAMWYSAADCLANPTLEDNMPTVNLEALACGTPVVAFDTGGCAEAIGNCGCVVPKKDVHAFCQKLTEYCALKADITEQCLYRAKQFQMARMGEQYIKLYEELLK